MNRHFTQFRSSKDRTHSTYHSRDHGYPSFRNHSYSKYPKFDSHSGTHPPNFRVKDKSLTAGQNLRPPKWDLSKLPPIKKHLYVEHPLVASRDDAIIEKFRNDLHILVQGHTRVKPIMHFSESNFPNPFLKALNSQFPGPTPIQSQSWPLALSGFNLVGIARTGSGKTLSYLLPGLLHIQAQALNVTRQPRFLVLTPTRELAIQVQAVCFEYSTLIQLNSVCIYGGSSKGTQIRELERGCDVVVATPGRLLDLLEMKRLSLEAISFCVLDEADRMLDMGFEPQIRKIMEQLRPDKQTLMWSATWPKDVKTLAQDFLREYIQIYVGSIELSANQNISQKIEFCEESEKSSKLLELLNKLLRVKQCKTIVFCETKRKVKSLTIWLQRMGYFVDCIHGDKEQYSRESVLSAFRQGRIIILVATDVASRGLDIEGIQNIINLDFPNVAEDYIHRIGRTARADNSGYAYTFFTPQNYKHSGELLRILQESNQDIPPRLAEINRDFRSFSRKRGRDFENTPSKSYRFSIESRNSKANYRPHMPHENVAPYSENVHPPSLRLSVPNTYEAVPITSTQLPTSTFFNNQANSTVQYSTACAQFPPNDNINQGSEWIAKVKSGPSYNLAPTFHDNFSSNVQSSFKSNPLYPFDISTPASQYDAVSNSNHNQY